MSKGLTLNPLTGRLKLTTIGELFSIKRVASDEVKEIPSNRQMILHGSLKNDGTLKNLGEIILITLEDKDQAQLPFPDLPDDNFSHKEIYTGNTKTIPAGQQMSLHGSLKNSGMIKNFGEIFFIKDSEEIIITPESIHEENFSIKEIASGESKKIPPRQQMIIEGIFKNFGSLKNLGELSLVQSIKNISDDQYLPPYLIDANEVYKIGKNRILTIHRIFKNYGTLINNGILDLRS